MEIIIKEHECYQQEQILSLYRSVGWSAYYDRPEVLKEAFDRSLCVFEAWDGDNLVGLIRAVGDGASIVFVQDILVRPEYQRRGIGTRLIAKLLQRYEQVRQLHLLTDDQPSTVGFYRAVGFTPVENIHCRAFTRVRY